MLKWGVVNFALVTAHEFAVTSTKQTEYNQTKQSKEKEAMKKGEATVAWLPMMESACGMHACVEEWVLLSARSAEFRCRCKNILERIHSSGYEAWFLNQLEIVLRERMVCRHLALKEYMLDSQ